MDITYHVCSLKYTLLVPKEFETNLMFIAREYVHLCFPLGILNCLSIIAVPFNLDFCTNLNCLFKRASSYC